MKMDGLPLDVILLVSVGLVAAVSLVAYISRKMLSNNQVRYSDVLFVAAPII